MWDVNECSPSHVEISSEKLHVPVIFICLPLHKSHVCMCALISIFSSTTFWIFGIRIGVKRSKMYLYFHAKHTERKYPKYPIFLVVFQPFWTFLRYVDFLDWIILYFLISSRVSQNNEFLEIHIKQLFLTIFNVHRCQSILKCIHS